MADVNIVEYDGNKKKNKIRATVGKIGFTLPSGYGDMVSGDVYKVASVPADSLILSVDLVVTEAFDGTTPTADIIVGSTTTHNDADLSSTGVDTQYETPIAVEAITDVTVTPTIVSATKGKAEVIVTFVERTGYDGAFTE